MDIIIEQALDNKNNNLVENKKLEDIDKRVFDLEKIFKGLMGWLP